jgi:pentatricopeptide repeat protein
MRKICQQSRRWHQQLSPFTNHSGHRQYIQQLWLPIRYQQRHYAKGRNDDLVVHEYEQVGSNKRSRVAVNPKAELEKTGKYLKSELERLDKELAELNEGPFGPNSEFMQSLSPEDRRIALGALQREGEALQDGLTGINPHELDRIVEDQDETEDPDHRPAPPQVTLKHPTEHQVYIRIFNAALKNMMVDSPITATKTKLALWKSYQRCLIHIPHFLPLLSAKTWDLLWRSQMELPKNNARNIIELAENMGSQSVPLSREQILLYLESLKWTRQLPAAIERWEQNRNILGPNDQVAGRFGKLGVELYSESNQPGKAQNIAMQCLNRGSIANATILLPVIASWARKNTLDSLEKAWACYLGFRAELGTQIKPEDYDTISRMFLRQGHPQIALSVFRDMVFDASKQKYTGHDSVSIFRRATGCVHRLQSSAINAQEISRVSLSALMVLPKSTQNKFFYASWIKRLIGFGDLDAASRVIELMYERGIRPDAKHVNGIIGGWLRQKSNGSRDKAEQMAWAMINKRIEFVRTRQMEVGNWDLISSPEDTKLPIFVERPVPVATIETFSILLVHYTRRCQDDMAEQLMEIMTKRAMIEPNSYILNHWLYASLRVQDLEAVWSQYQNVESKITPDLETFACLWDTAVVQWDTSRSAHWKGFPTARRLFRRMCDWMARVGTAQLIRTKQEFSGELYNQIIRVFCLSQDLRGTLCALHGLKQLFNEFPDSATSRFIVIQVARLLPWDHDRQPSRRRGGKRRMSTMVAGLSAVDEIVDTLTDQRAISLMDAGLDPHNLDDATAKQFQLDILSDLLVVILKKLASVRGDVKNEVQLTACEMGLVIDGVDFRKEERFG